MNEFIRRGDIYWANLGKTIGSEQSGVRPVVVVQNDIGNRYSPTVIVASVTSRISKAKLPTHLELKKNHIILSGKDTGLESDSVILYEQIRTIDKQLLIGRVGKLTTYDIQLSNDAINLSLGLVEI